MTKKTTEKKILNQQQYQELQQEIAELLVRTKKSIQDLTSNILADSYWQIGEKINKQNLTGNSNYQTLLLQNLEQDLKIGKYTLSKALRFYQLYPNGAQYGVSWTHYRQLITINSPQIRWDLTDMTKNHKLSVRQLEGEIRKVNEGLYTSSSRSKIKRPTDPSYLYKAKIINVVDGDTLILNIDLGFEVIKKQRVRLTQIDAPEMKSAAGKESHQYLRDLCASIEEVAVKTNKVDIYGRFLADIFYLPSDAKRGTTQADIFTKGIYLNVKIVEDGMAEVF